jgi:hypothetical protein
MRDHVWTQAGQAVEISDASLFGGESWYCTGCRQRSADDLGGLDAARADARAHAATCRTTTRPHKKGT